MYMVVPEQQNKIVYVFCEICDELPFSERLAVLKSSLKREGSGLANFSHRKPGGLLVENTHNI